MSTDEFISVHEIKGTKQKTTGEGTPVYQVQGKDNCSSGLIMKVGYLEGVHDVLINEFKLLNIYKCYIVSRLFSQWELDNLKDNKVYQMIKIIICKNGDLNNIPLCYLCFNFNANDIPENHISTNDNKIDLEGQYTITFHFKEEENNKYKILRSYNKYIGKDDMINKTIKCLFDENVLGILEKNTI